MAAASSGRISLGARPPGLNGIHIVIEEYDTVTQKGHLRVTYGPAKIHQIAIQTDDLKGLMKNILIAGRQYAAMSLEDFDKVTQNEMGNNFYYTAKSTNDGRYRVTPFKVDNIGKRLISAKCPGHPCIFVTQREMDAIELHVNDLWDGHMYRTRRRAHAASGTSRSMNHRAAQRTHHSASSSSAASSTSASSSSALGSSAMAAFSSAAASQSTGAVHYSTTGSVPGDQPGDTITL